MTPIRSLALAAGFAAMMTGSAVASAQSLPPLAENTYVTDRLIAARVADRIRKTCPTIGARLVYAFTQARALKRYAEGQGYSEAEIEAFLDDKAEKKKIYARAENYLKANGATEGNVDGFCALGQKEIAGKTIAGKDAPVLLARDPYAAVGTDPEVLFFGPKSEDGRLFRHGRKCDF